MCKQKRKMPKRSVIAKWWREHYHEEWPDMPQALDWDEPMCWGCGWPPSGCDTRDTFAQRWNAVPLTRCHLKDHWEGGPDTPENIVLMCHLCHSVMPPFNDRDEALRWVREADKRAPVVAAVREAAATEPWAAELVECMGWGVSV